MEETRSGTSGGQPSTDGLLDEVVELRLPAMAEQIPLVRMLTHGMVSRADFGLDAIADAKMAVDEACAQLVQLAELGTQLHCRFRQTPDALHVVVSARSTDPRPPSDRTFGWHVLTTLSRSVTAHCDVLPGGGAGIITIELVLNPGTSA
ncbi:MULTISPECIES: ATP-binding protein [unclassified Amycolatopsis]|uniref:ATP-binding protein n=1 Tax=unclassified Amycolatopsis TaxID=2618356 RepID=UPI002E1473A4|nr:MULTISPECIES: ATP-binding protein [unclassified Amycolatopsis]WSJ80238.1 ATP-binding protein [Amycolatopsis sp. NBC_01307]WSK76282.1 ATP-binding protein [Amycolatopsis sp. NBC_01286]